MQPFGCPIWLVVLAAIGAIAVVSVVVTLFFALGRRPPHFQVTEAPPVDSEEFLLGISGTMNAPLEQGGTARLLNNGVEIFPAILGAIRRAERSINVMCYIWEPGRASDRIFDALLERQRAGVQVRVMVDAVGGKGMPDGRRRELVEAGGKFQWFQALKIGQLTSFYKRNHRRAIVVDGKVAFTGGAAVADKWLGDAEDEEHWRDMMVEARGCLAANLQSSFTQLWANVCGEILLGDDFYPPEEEHQRVEGGEKLSRHVHVISSPAHASHPLRLFFWITFAAARERIWLTSPYFVPDRETRRLIASRARAGVDVRLLLPNEMTDAAAVRWAGHSYFQELLDAGVRIWEYQTTMIHAKTLVVDGMWSVVGSANMDIRSKELNQESVVGILDEGLGRQLEETFVDDLEQAREIDPEAWRRRGLLRRARERFWVLFAEQF